MPRKGHRVPLADRFWSRVARKGPDDCWLWTGGLFGFGYGACWYEGRTTQAHRLSWEMAHGPIPDGLAVLHRCDNPPCVNPSHLFLGTLADNTYDMMRKGRARLVGTGTPSLGDQNGSRTRPDRRPRGDAVKTSKLTTAQAEEIIRLASAGVARKEIAVRFGIHPLHVSRIYRGGCWKHLARPCAQKKSPDEASS